MGNRVPTDSPTMSPTPPPRVVRPTYLPGDLTVTRTDFLGREVLMSTGMNGRALTQGGAYVRFANGGRSNDRFHLLADGAAVYPNEATGGFYYSSNSETSRGGVGVLEFDANGDVIGYYRTLSGTSRNCGGGKTPWNTWISCEEAGSRGRVWQTDPTGAIPSERTEVVSFGGNYESFASDTSTDIPTFYITEDSSDGPLVRFTPDAAAMACYNSENDADKWCTLNSGSHDYLKLNDGCAASGTYEWVTFTVAANPEEYPNAEGIDVSNGRVYFVSKAAKRLFVLDVATQTYECSSTVSGAFNNQPDQIKIILDDPQGLVYFCEDGGDDCGIHARDANGRFFSIIDGIGYDTETTGLAFSPDAKYMFVSFQGPSVIWQFWREDGLPFTGNPLDIKYHA